MRSPPRAFSGIFLNIHWRSDAPFFDGKNEQPMHSTTLDSTRPQHGRWRISGRKDKQQGVLEYDPLVGFHLTLDTKARDTFQTAAKRKPKPCVIQGTLNNGERITLLNCLRIRSSGSFGQRGSHTQVVYKANDAIHGAWIRGDSARVFSTFQIFLTDLEDWLWVHPFEVQLGSGKDEHLETVHLRRPSAPFSVKLPEYTISADFAVQAASDTRWDRRWTYQAALFVEPKSPVSLREIDTITRDLLQLFALLVGRTVRLRATICESASNDHVARVTRRTTLPDQIADDASKHPASMPFSFDVIAGHWEEILRKWCERDKKEKKAVTLFFATMAQRSMYVEYAFLAMTQALEAYHRVRYTSNGLYTDSRHHKKIRSALTKAIPSTVDPSHRQALEAKLNYSNEVSQRRRFKDLANLISSASLKGKLDTSLAKFLDIVVDSRNDLVHHGRTKKSLAELHRFTIKLRRLLAILLLKDLGLKEEIILRQFEEIAQSYYA